MSPSALLVSFVTAVGTLKIATALACLAVGRVPLELYTGQVQPPPTALSAVFVLAFAVSGWFLVAGDRGKLPAAALGAVFVVIGSSFSNRLLLRGAMDPGAAAVSLRVLAGLNVDAWLPFLVWLFARWFPGSRPPARFARLFRGALSATALLGGLLFLGNSALTLETAAQVRVPLGSLLGDALASASPATLAPGMLILTRWLYYPLLLLVSVAIVPVVLNARETSLTDRRRILLFMGVLAGAAVVAILDLLLLHLSTRLTDALPRWLTGMMLPVLVHVAILSVPFATAYLVLVHRVIALRLVVRRALQYILARYSILAAGTLPYISAGLYLYIRREATLRDLFTGWSLVVLVASAVAAGLALFYRDRVLNALDRRFFREQYDARRMLGVLVEQSRVIRTVQELGVVFTQQIDQALHVELADLLVCFRDSDYLVHTMTTGTPLPVRSTLGVLLAASTDPLLCDLARHDAVIQRLPVSEREWLSASGYHLLVPLLSSSGTLRGALALGPRRSEVPYQKEERQLLSEAAAAGALALERLDQERFSSVTPDREIEAALGGEPPAHECLGCHLVSERAAAACPACGGTMIQAEVPAVLRATFQFVRRLGQGGTGVVYLATDLVLRRPVAIKTLPRTSAEGADRLRREARLTASVAHRNLALILGAEVWRGRPMLVFEFLERGTLADRLRQSGPLGLADALRLTSDLARALQSAHDACLIHGDVKPSNIGFTGRGVPKLLDFGVARLIHASRAMQTTSSDANTTRTAVFDPDAGTESGLSGTPGYLPPEAFDRSEPAAAFDLWAITLVLYEALAGRNPLLGRTPLESILLVRQCAIPPVTTYRRDCPAAVVGLLAQGLHPSPDRRHKTAFELHEALAACMSALGFPTGE